MLKHLTIHNYALIRDLSIDVADGFTVITGETGAGKSILIGAVALLTGQRADKSVIWNKERKCIIEAVFRIGSYGLEPFFKEHDIDYEDETILRREISINGKSRMFINDTPVNLAVIRDLAGMLIDIHSQFMTSSIDASSFQLAVVDSYAGNQEPLRNYRQAYNRMKIAEEEVRSLREKCIRDKNEQEYLQFLLDELDKANINPDEKQQLEEEVVLLSHAEEIKKGLRECLIALGSDEQGTLQGLIRTRNTMSQLSRYHKEIEIFAQRIESARIELDDLYLSIEQFDQNILFDAERLDFASSRIDLYNRLEEKHRVSDPEGLLNVKYNIEQKLAGIKSLDHLIEEKQKELKKLTIDCHSIGAGLSERRKKAVPDLESAMMLILKDLGMPHAVFGVRLEKQDSPGVNGFEKVQFLFNANEGEELFDLGKVASGGERSRLMLAVKSVLSDRNILPTIIFDEIDSGVSGETGQKVARILQGMSKRRQVIAITHLPQIAGKGEKHFFVYKESRNGSSETMIKLLSDDEKIKEIANLIGGGNVTPAVMQAARDLTSLTH